MTRHLNISPLLRQGHARATTPRGTCAAAVGLDVETFRGFQLAGELFLLTSSFIEPTGGDGTRGSFWLRTCRRVRGQSPERVLQMTPGGTRWHRQNNPRTHKYKLSN